ncbi:MAG TPA: hypothetical protein VK752_16800 [Bryobacteraceae bacterium]|nr:hypothetical protein [Bryobacteraceae bacterium]
MIRFLCVVFLVPGVALAAEDACAMVPPALISSMLGTTKNNGISNMKLPPKATQGKACTFVGKDNSATLIWFKFSTPAAAHDYLKTVRDKLSAQALQTTTENLDGEEGFSFSSGILAVKKNIWLRGDVYSTGGKVVAPDLTRQLILGALRAN